MLKHVSGYKSQLWRLITVQDNTMLKLPSAKPQISASLITVQDNTMLKQRLY